MDINSLLRNNIRRLKPYSCARDEFKGDASVYLDANESPYNSPYNRYPDPLQWKLKEAISKVKQVAAENIFSGNGSDEAIDLIYRAFCEPRIDNVVAIDPTYGMYKVCADINDVEYRSVLLDENFQFRAESLLAATDSNTKVIWICSPNNPSGNLMNKNEVETVINKFHGIVVVDEAYIDFASDEGFTSLLGQHPNLIVLQTMSKAWASAAIRMGMAFASVEIINVFNKVKYPYNINILSQKHALATIEKEEKTTANNVAITLRERERVKDELIQLAMVQKIYPSDANFLLVRVNDANATYATLIEKGIVVRNRNSVSLCLGCLRITIGTPVENNILIEELKKIEA